MSKLMLFACFGGAGVLLAFGDYMAKRWALGHGTWLILPSMVVYLLAAVGWFAALRADPSLVRMSLLWNITVTLASLVVGFLVFQERISAVQTVGGVLALASLVLLSL